MILTRRILLTVLLVLTLWTGAAWGSITGSISGLVTDPSGAVVPGVTVTAVNTETGIRSVVKTDGKGFYNFPTLAIGTYDMEIRQSGFKAFRQKGIVIDANSEIRVDVKLELGQTSEQVVVASDAVQVETQSTQMGEVITGSTITSVPLNGRSFTDLLSLQPGVVPAAYGNSVQSQFGGLTDRNPSGGLNAGNQSVNGQRQASNGFMVDGANVEEGKNNGAAIVPNLDSISEFRIITNNFDSEYGNFSGGQINVVTKSGTNSFHGDAFEFLRNTTLDARNFFDSTGTVPDFKQNQFGGTFGGPLKKDKVFFFSDYQGGRSRIGQPVTGQIVPSLFDRPDTNGGFADVSDIVAGISSIVCAPMATPPMTAGCVKGTNAPGSLASLLSTQLGKTVTAGVTPYFGCTSANPTDCVFPNNIIPATLFSPGNVGAVAANLLRFIPMPNSTAGGSPAFNTSAFNEKLRDDKGGFRADFNTSRWGNISLYHFLDDTNRDDPYPNTIVAAGAGGAPGFNASTNVRAQLFNIGDTRTFGSNSLNEFRVSFLRTAGIYFKPEGGLASQNPSNSLQALGFAKPGPLDAPCTPTTCGILPVNPAFEGVPEITFANSLLAIGVPQTTTNQANNTYQAQDNFSKIIGTHSLKFGGQVHWDQINERNFFGENGAFTFSGSETQNEFIDFLLGAPSGYLQASQQILDSRTKYFGLYAQDSWRARKNLTLNYGLRWEVSQPWYDIQNKTETIVPGLQSVVFPGAPTGYVVPGDPGIPSTLAPTRYNNFAPRLGVAYTPDAKDGILARLTGGPGKTSIRAGFGIYFTSIEDLSQFLEVGDPPYGIFYGAPVPPFLAQPFLDHTDGMSQGQRFPFTAFPHNVSASNPDATFPWAQVEPLSFNFSFLHTNRLPYAEHFELSLQRQFGSATVLTTSYVGTEGHRLVTSLEANPGSTALCNQLNSNLVASGTSTCGPFGENTLYTLPPGAPPPSGAFTVACPPGTPAGSTCIPGTRTTLNPAFFGNNPYVAAVANSAYHSLQVSLRHTTRRATFLVGYTFSKSIDNSSSLQDGTNPFNPRLSRSLSAFDVKHNFVASYNVKLPFDKLGGASSGWRKRVLDGWGISGITTFATGLPVTLEEPGDDASGTGATNPLDLPNIVGTGKILNDTNPRHGQTYFNTTLFAPETAGCTTPVCPIGNANRRFFHGPGINNWDMALLKDTRFTETKSLEFRFEAFNLFNHAQFANPSGNVLSPSFGIVTSTIGGNTVNNSQGRVLQAALKFLF